MGSDDSPAFEATHEDVSGRVPLSDLGRRIGPGHELGAYRILRVLGSGGMGEVFEAHDPRLQRSVAIKVLRRAQRDAGREHLVREALALAKLSHPNIVTIHEIDTAGDETFVVMEYVDGGTVRSWLAERTRSVREILRVFLDAGRGLVAAHGAGLVHRDFKLDNMLVDRKGRVRVSDFGLVASAGAESEDLAGTPSAMAPEQHDGEVVDARSDQYAFCVALYEALAGAPPFRGKTLAELVSAKRRGAPELPARKGVSRRLRAALARGLEADPERRHATMEPLLEALAWDPAARRLRVGIGAAMLLLAGTAAWGFLRPRGELDVCAAGAGRLGAAWGAEGRGRGRAAFLATGRPYAADSWRRVEEALDRQASRYAELRRGFCAAGGAAVEREMRVTCLDWRLEQLAELVRLFGQADAGVVDRGVRAVGAVDFGGCMDSAALLGRPSLPADPASRARVEAGLERVERVRALTNVGKYREGLVEGRKLVEEARALASDALLGRALLVTARMASFEGHDKEAEAMLREALPATARARDEETGAAAVTLLIWSVGVEQDRFDEAATLAPVAEAAVARAGGARQRADLDHTLGVLAQERGRNEESLEILKRGLALREEHPELPESDKAQTMVAIARTLQVLDRLDEAEGYLRRALEISQRVLGPGHINVAMAVTNLANLQRRRGMLDDAARLYEQAQSIYVAVFGEEHTMVASTLGALARVEMQRGRADQARGMLERAIAIDEKALGPDHPDVADKVDKLAITLMDLGRLEEADATARRALAMIEKRQGREAVELLSPLATLAMIDEQRGRPAEMRECALRMRRLMREGDADQAAVETLLGAAARLERRKEEALEHFSKALETQMKVYGPQSPKVARHRIDLAEAQLDFGMVDEAAGQLALARAVAEGSDAPEDGGMARLLTARVEWERGEREKAVETARAAEERCRAGCPAAVKGKIEAFLRKPPAPR